MPCKNEPSQGIYHHEDDLVEGGIWRVAEFKGLVVCQPWDKWLVGEETSGKDDNRHWDEYIGRGQQQSAQARSILHDHDCRVERAEGSNRGFF